MSPQTTGTVVLAWKTSGSKNAAKNARDIERGIGKTGAAAAKTVTPFGRMSMGIESIDKRTRKWAVGLKSVVAAVAALKVVKVATGWLKDAANNALEDEDSSRRLAIALRNTTHATKAQTAGVEEWISKQALAFGFVDDKLRPALQRLAQVTGSVTAAQKLTSLAMNVAAGSGKSLEVVSAALAKAQAGNMGALSRLGIRIKDAHGKALSFTKVIANMARTFKGQASAAAESARGRFARLSIQWDEMKEQLGNHMLPLLARLGGYILHMVLPAVKAWLRDFDNFQGSAGKLHTRLVNLWISIQRGTAWVRKNKDALLLAAQAALALYAAFKVVTVAVKIGMAVTKAYNATMFVSKILLDGYRLQLRLAAMEGKSLTVMQKLMTLGQVAFNAAMAANPIMLIVLGVTALIAVLALAYMKVDWFRNGVKAAFGFITRAIGGAIDWIKHNWAKVLVFLTGPVGIAVAFIATNFGKIVAVVRGVVAKLKSPLNMMIGLINRLIDGINVITGGASKLWSWAGIPVVPQIPHIPTLATGGRVETSGRVVRVAEAGQPESVFTDTQLGNLMGYAAARLQSTPPDVLAARLPDVAAGRAAQPQTIQLVTPAGQVLMEWLLDAAGARLART